MRLLAIGLMSALLAGCMSGRSGPAPAPGPMLVLEVTNQSSGQPVVSYEFTDVEMSGSGETSVVPCRREAVPISTISGDYRVLVDGEEVAEGRVPAGAGPEDVFVIRIRIAPGGEVEAAPPVVLSQPPIDSAAIPCG